MPGESPWNEGKRQKAVWESDEAYRTLVETSADGIALMSLDRTIVMANRRDAELHGYDSPEELLGIDAFDLLLPDERARAIEGMQGLIETNDIRNVEYMMLRKDGTAFPAEISASLVRDREGQPNAIVGIVRDVTERRRVEDALRARERQQAAVAELGQYALTGADLSAVLDKAVGLVAQTLKVDLVAVMEMLPDSKALLLLSGVGWQEGLVGHLEVGGGTSSQAGYTLASDEPVIAEDIRDEARFSAAPVLGQHGVVSVVSVVIRSHDGPWGVLAAYTTTRRVFTWDDTHFLQAVANVLATKIQRGRDEEQLRRIVRWRTSFLRIMAHELRTPLGQIIGFTDLLGGEAERLSERGQRYLRNVRAAAQSLELLQQRSFDLMRLHADDVPLERESLEIGHLVRTAIDGSRSRARAGAIELSYTQPAEQIEVRGDRQRLDQALDILLDNAMKFTPAGGTIEVRAHRMGEWVEIAVVDSGPGVPEEMREYIFSGQAEDVMTRRHGGTGLSLLMARRIAELHGGALRLEPTVQGACFILSLPVAR